MLFSDNEISFKTHVKVCLPISSSSMSLSKLIKGTKMADPPSIWILSCLSSAIYAPVLSLKSARNIPVRTSFANICGVDQTGEYITRIL